MPLLLTAALMLFGCHKIYSLDPVDSKNDGGGGSNGSVSSDADADTDIDADSDADNDTDADGDSDTDADTDIDSDSDTPFELAVECDTDSSIDSCNLPWNKSECWWQDATEDGVTCSAESPCPSGRECDYTITYPATNDGLCSCSSQSHCQMNGMEGICNVSEQYCGPSFCNGIKVCSIFGGCKNASWTSVDGSTTYNTATEWCENMSGAGFCCEGVYPRSDELGFCGYCSPDATCEVAYPD